MRAVFRIALSCILAMVFATTTKAASRTGVDGVAQAIQEHYFDAGHGQRIAADLRAAAARGEFDALTDPSALASVLTDRLKPIDRHFRVRWSPDADGRSGAGPLQRSRPPSMPRDANDPGSAHGIRGVQVLPGDIGYLSLDRFAHFEFGDADAPARRAIDAALRMLSGTRALIVDLRGNRGGSPRMVGYLTSAFTSPEADIYNTFHSRSGTRSEAPLERFADPRLDLPLYVLIDGRTGSAAESFAYTVKNAGRATVVGETSGGAANPGGEMAAGGGFFVFVPTGSPISPVTGTNWEGVGVAPDVSASSQEALEVAVGLASKAAPSRMRK